MKRPCRVPATVVKVQCGACRQVSDRGEYRLQSEDGSTGAMQSQPSVVAESTSNGSAEPLSDLMSLGRAVLQSLQPDAAEADETAQLVTPLVHGEHACASSLSVGLSVLKSPDSLLDCLSIMQTVFSQACCNCLWHKCLYCCAEARLQKSRQAGLV